MDVTTMIAGARRTGARRASASLLALSCCAVLLSCARLASEQRSSAANHARDMLTLAETYKGDVDILFKSLLKNSSKSDQKKLKSAKRVSSEDEAAFGFYAINQPKRAIHLTAGGLTSLDFSAQAAVIEHQLLNDDGWWLGYLLAERALVRQVRQSDRPEALSDESRGRGLKLWASPENVLGCEWEPPTEALQEERIRTEYNLRMNMLAFMLAHEGGHIVLDHNVERRPGEKADEYANRRHEHELAADNWALPALVRMRVDPYDVVRALYTHLVIFGRDDAAGKAHRGDLQRIRHVGEVYAREFPIDYGSFNENVKGLLDAIQPSQGDTSFFGYLDAQSDQVSFYHLHYTRRTKRVANFDDVCKPEPVIPAWIRELSNRLFHPKK